MSTTEQWRPVAGYPWYRISSHGRVLSTAPRKGNREPRILRPGYTTAGYPTVVLAHPARPKATKYIHHLVAEAFIGPRPEGLEIRHMDGDPANCLVTNLEYGTTSQNAYDRVRHGTHGMARKTHCINGHPFAGSNLVATAKQRRCRTCRDASNRRYRERQMLRAAGIEAAA